MKNSALPPIAVGLLLSATTSLASNPDDEVIVVTASRTAQTVDAALASVSVISRADIERSAATSVVDLLRAQAGIDLSRAGGPGQQTSLFLRGTNSNHVLVLVDGVRVASATTGIFAWQSLDLAQIERIEIVRGPRATLYGSDAVGGVVQIFTRQPRAATLAVDAGRFGTVGAAAGYAAGTTTRVSAVASYREAEGFSATNPAAGFLYDPDRDGYRNRSVSLGMHIPLGATTGVELNAWNSQQESDFDPADSRGQSQNRVVNLRLRHATANWVQTLSVSNALDDLVSRIGGAFPTSSSIVTHRNMADWQHDIGFGQRHLLTVGLGYLEDAGENTDTETNTVIFDRNIDNKAVFTQWQSRFRDHDIQLGLRHDDHSTFGAHTTGQAAWGWNLTPQLRGLVSYGSAFRAPSLSELYHPGFLFFGTYYYAGNAGLAPERSRTAELGLSYKPSGRHALRFNTFYTSITDLVAFEGVDFQAINIGRASMRGAELEYAFHDGPWRLAGSATLQKAINELTDAELLRRPRKKLAVRLDRAFGDRATLGAEVIGASRHRDIDNISFAIIDVPGYSVTNLFATYSFSPGWWLETRIENVFDKFYELASGYNTPPRSLFVSVRYRPAR